MKNVIQGTTLTGTGAVSVAPGAEITIRNPAGQLVPLWADRAGTQPHDNPFLTDSEGQFRVYADSGWVHVRAQKDGSVREWRYVPLGSAAAMDIGEVYEALGSEIYSSVSEGLSNSTEGDYFLVESSGSLDLYRVVNGVAEQRELGIEADAILATRAYADEVAAEAESNATNAAVAAASSAYQQATEYSDSELQTHRESGDHDGRYYTKTEVDQALDDKVDESDPRLSDSREWTASTVSQAEAQAGTSTTRRAWTAQRVRQAVEAALAGGAVGLPDPPVPETFLRAKADGSGYEALTAQQVAEAVDELLPLAQLYLGKSTTDPVTPITGSLLSGAMLAAGAIVEQGWNANGLYRRWESGLQVCVSYLPTGPWTYPARFGAERPFVFGTPIDGGNLGMIAGVGSSAEPPTSTATTVTIRDTNPPAVRYGHSGNWVAIGLWK